MYRRRITAQLKSFFPICNIFVIKAELNFGNRVLLLFTKNRTKKPFIKT